MLLHRRASVASLAMGLLLALSGLAAAEEAPAHAVTYSVVYTADLTAADGGGKVRAGRYLDNFDAIADVDLDKAVGWRGGSLHAYVLNNSGGAPNDVAGVLQGVDNIEVAAPRLRMFELWLEQGFGGGAGSVRAGLYNLNSEFYTNEAAGLLIAPAFGIGSELAATGPNGPSIFPSTALGVRFNVKLGQSAYARVAVLDAKAGVMGDPRGVDLSFGDGVLAIAQAGLEAPVKLSVGAWRYSHRQDDIRDVTPTGAPVGRRAEGVYLQAEQRLVGAEDGRNAVAFLRVGASDGDTTPFRGGWQAGVHIAQPFASRPDSAFSVGFEQGVLGPKFRANLRDQSIAAAPAESGVEVTYADRLTPRITLQPDVQWIRHAGGDRAAPDHWVVALRMRFNLASGSVR